MMKGAELERLVREDEVLRLRAQENMTYRQIAERVGLSHVMVGRILNQQIDATEENIRERRNHIAELLERAMKTAYDKYQETRLASDLHAFVKVAESYKALFALNGPQTYQHQVMYSERVGAIIDAVLVDAPQPGEVTSGGEDTSPTV